MILPIAPSAPSARDSKACGIFVLLWNSIFASGAACHPSEAETGSTFRPLTITFMDSQTDPDFLANEAYDDADQLDLRQRIQDRFGDHPVSWFRWCFDLLDLPPDARILDLGSGSGQLWVQNLDRLPPGWQVCLADLSPGILRDARLRLPCPPFHFLQAEARAVPFRTAGFHAVLTLGLLDHLPAPRLALEEASRLLLPGGRLFASAGSRAHLQELDRLAGRFIEGTELGGSPDHFGLENGFGLLHPLFSPVLLHRYQAGMVFRRSEPILIYLFSEPAVRRSLNGPRCEAFRRSLALRLQAGGPLRVTLDKGLFVARRR